MSAALGAREPLGRYRLEALFVLLGVSIAAISPFLPLLLRERGLRADEIGVVLAIISAAGLTTTGLIGHLGDVRLGRGRMLRIVLVLTAICAMSFTVVGDRLVLVIAAAALFGAASQAMHPLVDAVALDELDLRGRGDYGRVRLWASVSFAVAVLALGWLFQISSLELLVPVFALAVLACLLPLRGWRSEPVQTHSTTGNFLQTLAHVTSVAPRFPLFLGSVLLVNVAVSGTLHFLPLRMDDVGGSLVLIGAGAAIAAIVEIPVMLSTGWFTRLAGPRSVYLGSCVIYAGCFVALVATDNPTVISVVWGVSGIAYALLHVGSVVIVATLVPVTSRGLGQGTLQTVASGIAPVAGAWAGGSLYARFGSGTVFTVAVGLAVAAGVVAWLALDGRRATAAEVERARDEV
jgi:MFS transporter, PPP family, 3-phenylpropionic acid transporter